MNEVKVGDLAGEPDVILLVRHARTAWNAERRFRGSMDVPLDEVGVRQAKAAAQIVAPLEPSLIVASPLSRAQGTARAIAEESRLESVTDDALRDYSYGQWEGRAELDVARESHDLYVAWKADPFRATPPGGENAFECASRLILALYRLHNRSEGTGVAVSHEIPIRLVLHRHLRLGAAALSLHLQPASIVALGWRRRRGFEIFGVDGRAADE
jgi:broad specificity phosphatase PhoE